MVFILSRLSWLRLSSIELFYYYMQYYTNKKGWPFAGTAANYLLMIFFTITISDIMPNAKIIPARIS